MRNINTGGPAFPLDDGVHRGMTMRDYFAAKSLPSILSPNPVTGQYALVTDFEDCAITAYKMADAMLKARGND